MWTVGLAGAVCGLWDWPSLESESREDSAYRPLQSHVSLGAQGQLHSRAGQAGTAREAEVGEQGSARCAAESPAPRTGK